MLMNVQKRVLQQQQLLLLVVLLVIVVLVAVDVDVIVSASTLDSTSSYNTRRSINNNNTNNNTNNNNRIAFHFHSLTNSKRRRIRKSLQYDTNRNFISQQMNRNIITNININANRNTNQFSIIARHMHTKNYSNTNNDNNNNNNKKKKNDHKKYPTRKQKENKRTFQELNTIYVHQLKTIYESSLFHTTTNNNSNNNNDDERIQSYKYLLTLESNVLNLIWSSQSIQQIHDVLWKFITFVKHTIKNDDDNNNDNYYDNNHNNHDNNNNHNDDDTTKITYHDLKYLGPNIASAALRRMIDIRPSLSRNTDHDDNDMMMEKMIQSYIPILLQILSREIIMIGQRNGDDDNVDDDYDSIRASKIKDLTSSTSMSSSSSFEPFQKWINQVESIHQQYSINVTTIVSPTKKSNNNNNNNNNNKAIFEAQFTHYSLVNILYSLGTLSRIVKYQNDKEQQQQMQQQQQLQILTQIQNNDIEYDDNTMSSTLFKNEIISTLESSFSHLVENICFLLLNRNIHQLTPKRSIEVLTSLATIIHSRAIKEGKNNIDPTTNSNIRNVIESIGNRVHKGDAIGQFNGRDLSLGLWSLYIIQTFHLGMIKSFTRKLRKQAIREEMTCNDLCRSIWSISQLMYILEDTQRHRKYVSTNTEINQGDDFNGYEESTDFEEDVHCRSLEKELIRLDDTSICQDDILTILDECLTCICTLVNELVRDRSKYVSNNKLRSSPIIQSMQTREFADVLSTCAMLKTTINELTISELISKVHALDGFIQQCSAIDIARILRSMQQLKIHNQNEFVLAMIRRFVYLIDSHDTYATVPRTLTSMLRSIVLILADNGRNEKLLLQTIVPFLKDEKYLEKCNEFEISNIIFVLAKAKFYDKDVLMALAFRMTNENILATCTTSSASRFLWSMTSLVKSTDHNELEELLFQMFQSLGGILLSPQITSIDASSAMWSMAKSSYSLDKGVFDHLAEMLAKDHILQSATVQHVCQALWACGKMINFEDQLNQKIEHGEVTPPPYYQYATKYASFLVSHVDQMNSKDIAQVRKDENEYVFHETKQ